MGLARIILLALSLYLGGCTSPEASRTRGGGPGADVGNRSQIVQMHEGSRPYAQTPQIIAVRHPSLEPGRQADRLSREQQSDDDGEQKQTGKR